jgi:hypothetical protein
MDNVTKALQKREKEKELIISNITKQNNYDKI